MAQDDKNKTDEKDMVRKIWLAGIGAYGRAFTEAKGAVDSLTGKSSAVFDDLVAKGEMVEVVGKFKAEEILEKSKAAVEDITPDFEIDERIARMRSRLSGVKDDGSDRLAARVDQLEAKLDAILAHLEIGDEAPKAKRTTRKTPAKKAPVKKAAAKKKMTTQKTTAKKPETKKKS